MSKPERTSPLAGYLKPGHHGATGGEPVTLRQLVRDAVEITTRRAQEAAVFAVAKAGLRLDLPAMGAAIGHEACTAMGIGPGNWMIVSEPYAPGALATRVKAALGATASVADVGHGLAVLELSGTNARQVLAKGCRLDLHPSAFKPGHVARTIIAQMPIMLWQVDAAPTFALAAPITFAQSFARFLLAASAETGCTILPASGTTP